MHTLTSSGRRPDMRSRVIFGVFQGLILTAAGVATTLPATAQTCDGITCTIVGTSSGETLNGTSGADVICGLAGNDTINAGGGNDIICAGVGDDTINGGV